MAFSFFLLKQGGKETGSYRILRAKSRITLSIALRDFNSPVDIVNVHGVVDDVLDAALTTAPLEFRRQERRHTRPDFDAGAVL